MDSGRNIAIIPMQAGNTGIGIFAITSDSARESELWSVPHRHDYYCCFIATSGSAKFKLDFQLYEIEAPSIMIVCPGQVHEIIEAEHAAGWVLEFKKELVDEAARSIFDRAVAPLALLELTIPQIDWFVQLMSLMYQTGNDSAEMFGRQVLQSMTNAFFHQAARIFEQQEMQLARAYSVRKLEIVQKFRVLLKARYRELKRPADYAAKMNITVSHLNDTTKSVTGFSATWMIQQEVFTEARRLLLYTTSSIKEVSHALGFEDDKYFTRLFQKRIGVSPSVYRQSRLL